MTESIIINPKTSKPFTKAETNNLTQQQSKSYVTSVRKPTEQTSIARGLTPNKLGSILRNVLSGELTDYAMLAEEMEERDLHYRAVLSTRKLAVAHIRPSVEAASDDPKHIEHADAVRKLLKNPETPELYFDLLDGLGKGFSVVEIIWDTKTGLFIPNEYKWVDPRHLVLDKEDLNTINLLDDNDEGFSPLKEYGYVIHKPRTKSGHFIRNGLARLVAVMHMLKSYTVKDWWSFAEMFGMPIRIGKYHSNASDGDIRTLINAIASIASDAGAVIPESMQIEMIETSKGKGGETLFENMVGWADAQISKAVLGQTMTTDNGSSQSQATVHNEVRKDIIKWDARQLAMTLNQYLVKPFIDLNYGVQDGYPEIQITLDEPEDVKSFVDALTPLIDRGLKVQASDVRDRLGIPDPDDGSELLHPEGQDVTEEQAKVKAALNRVQIALNRQNLDTDAEQDTLVYNALNDWDEISKPITNPILNLASECDGYEDFAQKLALLQDELDPQELVEQMTMLCFQARALGDSNA